MRVSFYSGYGKARASAATPRTVADSTASRRAIAAVAAALSAIAGDGVTGTHAAPPRRDAQARRDARKASKCAAACSRAGKISKLGPCFRREVRFLMRG